MLSKFRVRVLIHFSLATIVFAEISSKHENEHFSHSSVFRNAGHGILTRKGYWEKTLKTVFKKVGQPFVNRRIERDAPIHNLPHHRRNSFEAHYDKPEELQILKENGNNMPLKTTAGKEINDYRNEAKELASNSLNGNLLQPKINQTVVYNSNETDIPYHLTFSNVDKSTKNSSVNGLVHMTTNGQPKSNTKFVRQTTKFNDEGITLDEEKVTTKSLGEEEHIENSKEVRKEKNVKSGSDTAQQEPSSGNLNENVTDLNNNHVSQISKTTFTGNEEHQTPSLKHHTSGNKPSDGKGQRRTQNPMNSNFKSNDHDVTTRNPANLSVTDASKANIRNRGTPRLIHNTDIAIVQGNNTVTKSEKTISPTLKIVSQTKRDDTLKKEQNVTKEPTTIPVITNSEQSISSQQKVSIFLHENFSEEATKPIKVINTSNTDHPTTMSRTQTTDKSLHWKNYSKQTLGDTRKESDRAVHATTPVLAPRHTSTYDYPSVLVATLGGAFLGGLLVFAIFYCKKRITRYIRGDYRRLPMEYDFELNPRLKS